MSIDNDKLNSFTLELGNHSPEGIDILSSEPSKLISSTIYLLFALIICAFVWSFVGKQDVIIVADGTITPDSKIQRVYSPLEGKLIDIYIYEGMPVKKNDVIARIHASKAIQHTDPFMNAKSSLARKERDLERFLAKKKLLEQKAELIRQRYHTQKSILDRSSATIFAQITETHKFAVKNQRIEIEKSALKLKQARNTKEKYERLYSLPGKGGVSKKEVTEKRNAYNKARVNYTLAKNKIDELETTFNKEKEAQLLSEVQVVDTRVEYEQELESIKQEEAGIRDAILAAKLLVDSTTRVAPENIDNEGFVKIYSPFSGIISEVAFSQPGDKVQYKTPLATIVPTNSKIIVAIEIPESKRALLKEGQTVKLKVTAFAYQRYGFITGTLDYISPTTRISQRTKKPHYKGHVSLHQTAFSRDDIEYPLRVGMTAIAEIVVRQRRIIDFVLDPIRGLSN